MILHQIQKKNLLGLAAKQWDYSPPPLTDQLNMGVRNFELDAHMRKYSAMFYHLQMWDQSTNGCDCYVSCFNLINDWSNENPSHFPLYILIEPKLLGFWEDSYMMTHEPNLLDFLLIEQQAIQIFGEKIVTPDALRNEKESVQSSALGNMPTVDNFYGKIFFIIWSSKIPEIYENGTDGLKGRAFFTKCSFHGRFQRPETIFRKSL